MNRRRLFSLLSFLGVGTLAAQTPPTVYKSYTLGSVDEYAPAIGVLDGVNKIFTVSLTPLGPAWVWVMLNGVPQPPSNFTLKGQSITLSFVPKTTDALWVRYQGDFLQ